MENNTNTILAVLTCVVIFFLIFEMFVNNQNVNRLSIPIIPTPPIPTPIPTPIPPIPTPSENITINLSNRRNNNNNNAVSTPAPVPAPVPTTTTPTPAPTPAPVPTPAAPSVNIQNIIRNDVLGVCTSPSQEVRNRYDNITETNMNIVGFEVIVGGCVSGDDTGTDTPSPSASVCTASGYPYILSGCP